MSAKATDSDGRRDELDSRIYGCGAAPAIRPLTRQDIPPKVRADIRALQRHEPWGNLPLLLLLPIAGAGAWATAPEHGLALRAAGTVVLGLVLMSASVLMHEGIHYLLVGSRRINRIVALCCGTVTLLSATAYRTLHLRHHAFEHTGEDPDNIETAAPRRVPLVLVYYGLLLAGTYLYFPHVAVGGWRAAHTSRERLTIVCEYLFMIGALGAGWWHAPDAMLRLWLLPMLVAAQLTNLRGLAEHGLTTGGSPFTATRSVRTSRWIAFFLCNLNLHLEHHLFPAVPWYNLPRVHALLQPVYRAAGASVYDGYGRFFRDFFRTTWAGVIPDVRLLPARLREELCG
ncbi:MAG TPA: fatty acid desaturase [Gemmatimonadales bacterium]|jgi:fatty acid desaturase|nr:fatty acid desaturase [Gemmatimonadales bacterium]